jgi:hypothetical protein
MIDSERRNAVERGWLARSSALAHTTGNFRDKMPEPLRRTVQGMCDATCVYFAEKQKWAENFRGAIQDNDVDLGIDFKARVIADPADLEVEAWPQVHPTSDIQDFDLRLVPTVDVLVEGEALDRHWKTFCTWKGWSPDDEGVVISKQLTALSKSVEATHTESTLKGFSSLRKQLQAVDTSQQQLGQLLDAHSDWQRQYETYLQVQKAAVAGCCELVSHQSERDWIEAEYALFVPAAKAPEGDASTDEVTDSRHLIAVKAAREERLLELRKQARSAQLRLGKASEDLAQAARRFLFQSGRYVAEKRQWELEYKQALRNDTAKVWNVGETPLLTNGDTAVAEPINPDIDLAAKVVSTVSDAAVREWVAAHSDCSIEEIDLELETPMDVEAEEEALAEQWRLFCAWQELPLVTDDSAAIVRQQVVIHFNAHVAAHAAWQKGESVAPFPADTYAALERYCELHDGLRAIKNEGQKVQSLLEQTPALQHDYESYRRAMRAVRALEREAELYHGDAGWIEAQVARLSPAESGRVARRGKGDQPAPHGGLVGQQLTCLLIPVAVLLLTIGSLRLWPPKPMIPKPMITGN